MAGINKFIGIGNLTADPEIKYIPSGDAVTNFSIACNETWTQDGQKKERTEFVRCVAWKRLAEIIAEYCQKGKPIYVEGRLQTRTWDNKEGVKQYTTEIVVNQMQMLGGGESKPQSSRPVSSVDDEGSIPF